jgi:hypothetical protein
MFAMRTPLFARPDPSPHYRHVTHRTQSGWVRLGGTLRKVVFWKFPGLIARSTCQRLTKAARRLIVFNDSLHYR